MGKLLENSILVSLSVSLVFNFKVGVSCRRYLFRFSRTGRNFVLSFTTAFEISGFNLPSTCPVSCHVTRVSFGKAIPLSYTLQHGGLKNFKLSMIHLVIDLPNIERSNTQNYVAASFFWWKASTNDVAEFSRRETILCHFPINRFLFCSICLLLLRLSQQRVV